MKKAPKALRPVGGGLRVFSRIAGFLCAVNLVALFVLLAPQTYADQSAVDNVSVTVPVSCSMGSDASNHTYSVSLVSGHLVSGIGGTTIKAYCNDNNGYTIYAVGASDYHDGNTDLISSYNTDYNIHTGTSVNGNTSSWAMKITAGTVTNSTGGFTATPPIVDTDYTAYHAVPSVYHGIAWRTSATDMATDVTQTGSYITAEYQVYANTMQPSGTYTGQVKYAMLHPYGQSNIKSLSLVLDEAFTNGTLTNDDMVSITDQTTGRTKSYYKMQSLTDTMCDAVTVIGEASQIQMVDARDNKLYWVTKLEDGHCWMTQNLDLDLTAEGAANPIALTSENTDLNSYAVATEDGDTTTGRGYNTKNGYSCANKTDANAATSADCSGANEVITWLPERTTIATNNLSSSTWTNDYNNPYSYDPGDGDAVDSTMNNAGAGDHGLTGNYYNWTAAIASNASNNFTASTYSNIANSPKNSVCPKGWRLPTISNASGEVAGSTNEFRRLNVIYNENKTSGSNFGMAWTQSPLYFPRAGFVSGGSLGSRGSIGVYWSSTVSSSNNAYNLNFNSGAVYPENSSGRSSGFSVRCMLR